jgi:hypothetical protein
MLDVNDDHVSSMSTTTTSGGVGMAHTVDLHAVITQALRAPSVHNTQPWRWRVRPGAVELYADWNRHLPWTDPDRRDLVLSCGAALHHLRVALAARDSAVQVHRLPDPEDGAYLATVTVQPGRGDPEQAELCPAISRRRTDRRQMSHRPVPDHLLRECVARARREGAELLPITSAALRQRLGVALATADREQAWTPGYPAELAIWTHRYAGARDGVPATHVPPAPDGMVGASPLRRFGTGSLAQPRHPATEGAADDAAELLVLSTSTDDTMSWLVAGEATSAVLLTATLAGLATTPLSQGIEVATSRRQLRSGVLRDGGFPQLIIRMGWPASRAGERPPTPRRDLGFVLLRS